MAEKEFEHAIKLNPKCAMCRQWYEEFLVMTGGGRKGITQIDAALALDPLSPIIAADRGW